MAFQLSDYQVGWISALAIEGTLAVAMLDVRHPRIPTPNDDNAYTFGQNHMDDESVHNVVILCLGLGRTGKASTAAAAESMQRTFPSLKFTLMVGIAGGVWSEDADVRLGDIVVGASGDGDAGVIQYDFGKTIRDRELVVTKRTMNKPPRVLLNAVSSIQAKHGSGDLGYLDFLEPRAIRRMAPRPYDDYLFNRSYHHEDPRDRSCRECDTSELRPRPRRSRSEQGIPKIHYGRIASGDQVMKSARIAEKIRRQYGILCFEMEAAGLDDFQFLAIRGISDYADSHKNDEWHAYAAAAAAAYAKELLTVITSTAVPVAPKDAKAQQEITRSHRAMHIGNVMDSATAMYGDQTFSGVTNFGGTHSSR
ncbi:purine and uridine phosphorylase [Aureobasidium pullulans]|uniref:Purine and uridine phosphorylase n=1 Tax=Aureobasidium pullulans TaxID=5580 RepID=A0A4S8T057_AURPU|nr:purine and uridine phosphorylase [Aureobasidium pullulans]